MISGPEHGYLAIPFDWETLLPVLFFILYGLSQIFGNRKKGQEEETQEETEEDPFDRARRIREEIQRKIRERASGGEASPADGSPGEGRPAYDPTQPDGQQQRRAAEAARQLERPRPAEATAPRRPEPLKVPHRPRPEVHQAREVAVSREGEDITHRLAEQRKRLDAARRRQQEARAQAVDIERRAGIKKKPMLEPVVDGYARPAANLRRGILKGLRDPESLRRAVLYREILDPPVGMRR